MNATAPKLNLGCGPVQPDGWINVDGSNRAKLAGWLPWLDHLLVKLGVIPPTEYGPHIKVLNLFKPLPWADNSVAAIYAGELWEHFEYADAEKLTRECFRALKPGGILRVTVPDTVEFWSKYLRLYEAEIAKPANARSDNPLREHVAMFFHDIATKPRRFGSWGHYHKWCFDEVQLRKLFERVGFVEVERRSFRDSRIPGVEGVERAAFLTVEGVKPN
jgi:predicted SAM-dependent methyltransferase